MTRKYEDFRRFAYLLYVGEWIHKHPKQAHACIEGLAMQHRDDAEERTFHALVMECGLPGSGLPSFSDFIGTLYQDPVFIGQLFQRWEDIAVWSREHDVDPEHVFDCLKEVGKYDDYRMRGVFHTEEALDGDYAL